MRSERSFFPGNEAVRRGVADEKATRRDNSSPAFVSLRADVEVPLGGNLIHAQRLDVARGVQNLRRARALVQRHNLGFVPHAVVGPIQLFRAFRGCATGAREARRIRVSWTVSVGPARETEQRKRNKRKKRRKKKSLKAAWGSTDREPPRGGLNRRFFPFQKDRPNRPRKASFLAGEPPL